MNGTAPPSAVRSVPRVLPYQSRWLPRASKSRDATSGTLHAPAPPRSEHATGPCHILSMADASLGVRHVPSDARQSAFVIERSSDARYLQVRGSSSTPSDTPSCTSHAATAFAVASFSLARSTGAAPPPIGPPLSRCCTTEYHAWPDWNWYQWIAGAAERMTS